jgi:hypothetical protein
MAADPAESAVRNYLASLTAPDMFRRGFIEHAKAWAEAEGITAGAFEQMGVPPEVLREAGIVPGTRPPATPARPDVRGSLPENGTPSLDSRSPAGSSASLSVTQSLARRRSAAWKVRRSFCRIVTGEAAIDGLRRCGLLR